MRTEPESPRAEGARVETYVSDASASAMLGRSAVVLMAGAITYRALRPGPWDGLEVEAYPLGRFVAFYALTLAAAAAFPRSRLRNIALGCIFAVGLFEAVRSWLGEGAGPAAWAADVFGVLAALAPIATERFRRLFKPKDR